MKLFFNVIPECFYRESRKWIPAFAGMTLVVLAGCQTVQHKPFSDPQAQSALRSIKTALSPEHTVKYCPEDGERFSADMIWCPDHKVKLEWVE